MEDNPYFKYYWDKLQCFIFPMWIERVLFFRKEKRSCWNSAYWKNSYGEQVVSEKFKKASLLTAILDRDYRLIRELVAHGLFSLEDSLLEEKTPLQYAIQQGDTELVRVLLSLNASVCSGYAVGFTPIELVGKTNNKEITKILLEAFVTDLALEEGLIPGDFGFGEWDSFWEGDLYYIYSNYDNDRDFSVDSEEDSEIESRKQHSSYLQQDDDICLFLFIGITDSEEAKSSFFRLITDQLAPYGYQVWKTFWDYDQDCDGKRTSGTILEIQRYTFFYAKDKWKAYEYMFPYDKRMEEHLNVLRKWDEKYGVVFQELDYECLLISFERMPEDREKFWTEAILLFPIEDDFDAEDKERRHKRFINNEMLELLML